MINNPELIESHREAVLEQFHRQLRNGIIICLILLPTGFWLDSGVYPDIKNELAKYRWISELLILLIFFLQLIPGSIRFSKVLSLLLIFAIEVPICMMILASGEVSGPYYAGLNLVALGFILILPLYLYEAIVLTIVTTSLYTTAIYLGNGFTANPEGIVNNYYFLISTCFIGCCSSYFRAKSHFREFKLNYELDLRTKQLAELDKVKSDFYANVSHEFRTPLTLILAPVEDLLAKKNLADHVKNHLQHIRENAFRLLKLVNDLLDVQKLEEQKDFLEEKPVKINSLLENTVDGMKALAERRALNLSLSMVDEDVVVIGDFSALEKIFINLINNAIKFTDPDGKIVVNLKLNDSQCVIEVIDTGQGISGEDLDQIFERFKQADSSSTRQHQGTGLGLSLVKELTQLHHGDIKVESSIGEGTTMRVSLPVANESPEDLAEENPEVQTDDGLQSLHRAADMGMTYKASNDLDESVREIAEPETEVLLDNAGNKPKLLIVEDEPGIREYLRETMADSYQVSVAIDGPEGLYMASDVKPDLIILDWMLPKMNGLTICAAIKNDPELRGIKVMLLTAKSDEKSKIDALDHGADDFLTKPFSTIEIKTRIRNLWNTSLLQKDVEQQNRELQKALVDLKATQGQLIQSEKLNALGRLAAGLLHEVNNPLNISFATFQLLEREECVSQDDYAKDLMADIREGMERISAIVKDLKAFAYPESADLRAMFPLQTAVESAIRFTSAKASNTELINQVGSEHVLGSQSHVVQVLVNLIENAIDALESAAIELPKVIISSLISDKNRVFIRVEDNGPGIPKEIQDKIFDPFYTTKDVGSGLGMGLSICHTIVNNHGGSLKIERTTSQGTVFGFDLANAAEANEEYLDTLEQVSGE